MLYETIDFAHRILLISSPLIGLILFASAFALPADRLIPNLGFGILLGFIGCTWIDPIDVGAWGFGVIGYFFAGPFWFSLGFLLSDSIFYAWAGGHMKRGMLSISFCVISILSLIMQRCYVEPAKMRTSLAVQSYMNGSLTEEALLANGYHQSKIFQNAAMDVMLRNPIPLKPDQIEFLRSLGY
jgi:hypothetical protein